MLFDTHVNLHHEAFAEDCNDVVVRARSAGVTRFISICDRLDNFDAIRSIVAEHPDMWCSVGVHPHHAKDYADLTVDTLAAACADMRVCGVGETGLDLHYGYSALDDQVKVFTTHIQAARTAGVPVIIHTREADQLTADILEREYAAGPFAMLLHCYTGGADLALRAARLGAYFSVSGIFSFKSARAVREVICALPADRIILETDCPYLAPMPHRGRRNEPAMLVDVCRAYAEARGASVEDIAARTTENALRLFTRIS